ncbi:glycosyltransferase family 2 protein [Pseudomonas akapageensis]|uniref:glycosyltransferase family 2 protein n=1 Tax=Pseudomonas akapageensis TaxID=2609961 RepID=UPI00140B4C76|nr:glycosyltransferase family 2 protein [Pseudomonas akapageensis]
MQGNFGFEKTAQLHERLTLVLMTHNRPAFLRRTLQYYSGYPCSIIVLDSSTRSADEIAADFPGVEYLHLPQFSYLGFQAKLKYGIGKVTTPYMAFAADDDFLLHGALTESVEFLEANPDYGMCHGYSMMYLAEATQVNYYRRDKKVCEDYADERAEQRVLDYMGQFIPPFFAVTRTALLRNWFDLMPDGLSFEWQEIGHVYFLLASAKARILPIPYAVREANYGSSEHKTEVVFVLSFTDAKSVAEREQFADFLSTIPTAIAGLEREQIRQLALDSFAAMAQCLQQRKSLTLEPLFSSSWTDPLQGPVRQFGPTQYMEMPFYNKAFFDCLTEFEFLLHAMPAGRLQLERLEPLLLKQEQLLQMQNNDTPATVKGRLWEALDATAFNRTVVKRLAQALEEAGEKQDAEAMFAWAHRLDSVSTQGGRELLGSMHSGRLLDWLEARNPTEVELAAISAHLEQHGGAPQFGILLLDLHDDMNKLQTTFDSLLRGYSKAFRIVVFTIGDVPALTSVDQTLHFIKVGKSDYVAKINEYTRQSSCDWLMLAEAGDMFTPAGLLRASLELLDAPQCRAVAVDEIQQQSSGAWREVFRPAFNLDLLQSLPSMLARHWLVRREELVAAGGYSSEFTDALEFDLLLRLIEQGGLSGLAHLDEPVLISQAPALQENQHERQTLIRHLASRGYKAHVSSAVPGTYRIDYRHTERPQVSIIVRSNDDLADLQRCLDSVQQRTRYLRYEILIVDNNSQTPQMLEWLERQERPNGRVRVLRSSEHLSPAQQCNAACEMAQGEYLIFLAADAQVVNANWIEALLNQAQRPEVGVVGAKLINAEGVVTQAGLVLGLGGTVGAAFAGQAKDATGYLQRLVVEQNYSAVSSACLMIRRELYKAIGGLDEDLFAQTCGDIDLCLKAGEAGFLVVWTPQVQIVHPGTLPSDEAVLAALRDKWQVFAQDPAYNQNLATTGNGFVLSAPKAVDWVALTA